MNNIDYVYLETTNYCNLDCSFCNRNEVIGKLQHQSPFVFNSIMEKIKHYAITEAKLMGMGEPFLHPQFDIITSMFKQYFPDAFLISATNCQYDITNMPWFERSLKNIDLLYLSIDGYKETYERDRAPSKWNKLIAFLDEFDKLDRHGCRVTCNYVVNPDNVDDIQRVYDEIVVPYGLEELRLNIAQSWSPDDTIPTDYTDEQIKYLRDTWKENIKGHSEWNFSECFWVQRGLYTTVEGRVLTCCMNTAANSYGNILKDTIEDILATPAYQAVKRGCETNNPTEHCANCSYKELNSLLYKLGV